MREREKQLEIDKNGLINENGALNAELDVLKGGYHALSTKTNVEKELKTNNERLAKAEAELIRSEKKYDITKQ